MQNGNQVPTNSDIIVAVPEPYATGFPQDHSDLAILVAHKNSQSVSQNSQPDSQFPPPKFPTRVQHHQPVRKTRGQSGKVMKIANCQPVILKKYVISSNLGRSQINTVVVNNLGKGITQPPSSDANPSSVLANPSSMATSIIQRPSISSNHFGVNSVQTNRSNQLGVNSVQTNSSNDEMYERTIELSDINEPSTSRCVRKNARKRAQKNTLDQESDSDEGHLIIDQTKNRGAFSRLPSNLQKEIDADKYRKSVIANNEASKRSRERKKLQRMLMEKELNELTHQNDALKKKKEKLERDRSNLLKCYPLFFLLLSKTKK